MPRWLSASVSASGTRRATAARPTGPATYPPPPSTASKPVTRRRASSVARAARPAARAARSGFRRSSPVTASGWNGYPAAGTSSASARSPPANSTCAPLSRSAPATASAGTTWPAVPPAAISTRVGSLTATTVHRPQLLPPGARRHAQEQPHRAQQDDHVRVAVGDERQRNAREGRHAHHREEVEHRLGQDQRRDPRRQQLLEAVAGELGGAEAGIADQPV